MTDVATTDLATRTVGVAGTGRLAASVRAAVARPAPADPGSCALVLAVGDGWGSDHAALDAACRAAGTPWLPVRVEPGVVVIGPLVRPGVPGCASCAQARRRAARHDGARWAALLRRYGTGSPCAGLTGLVADTVAALVAAEAQAVLDGTGRTEGAVLCVALDSLATTAHRFLPDPLCPTCGTYPADTPDAAVLALEPRPKPAPDGYRIRPLDAMAADLLDTYVDAEAGIVSAVLPREAYGLAVADAPIGLRVSGLTEHGFGRTLDHRSSGLCAVLEALERYGGYAPGRVRPAVWASYVDVRAQALDPRTLGLPEPGRHPGYAGFAADEPVQWVWGWSFRTQAPILVPASIAFYGHTLGWLRGRPLGYETSNGCALGSCLEEAVLYGILEVAERDAFLMTWYARLPVPRIALDSVPDRRVPLLAERVARASGYRIGAFATTLEQGVPAVLALAIADDDGSGRAKALCAAAAHLDPAAALGSALAELVPALATTPALYARQVDRVRAMVADPDLVRAMSDHALLYCDPDAFDRLDFLTAPRPELPLAQAFPAPRIAHADLRDDLTELVDRYLAGGLDVIVVDQTTAEHRAGGLRCVKVIIPGTLPMTFGHAARRTDGLPRLLTVPHRLGYRDGPLDPADLNPHPHPFP